MHIVLARGSASGKPANGASAAPAFSVRRIAFCDIRKQRQRQAQQQQSKRIRLRHANVRVISRTGSGPTPNLTAR